MKALAANIAKEQPALVGLQEVLQFQCVDLVQRPPVGVGCSDPSITAAFSDHLQLTLDALDGTYVEAATVINLNIPVVPFNVNGVDALLGVVDRDVILARSDIDATPVDYTAFQGLGICLKASADGCNYSLVLQAQVPGGPIINVERGFVAVDATVNGKNYRLVTTHLEVQRPDPTNPLSQVFQAAQAGELLQILLNTTPPGRSLIVVGDMNSSPAHLAIPGPLPLPPPFNLGIPTPYLQFVAAGLTDIWQLRPGNLPGYTCCQAEDLSNHKSAHYERIDMIFSLEIPARVKQVRLVADKVSDKTRPPGRGLWPSDHAGVTADLQFQLLTAQN
jgi:endonuclease/exonuclease/phosphatase family metal-dependent hydrolase